MNDAELKKIWLAEQAAAQIHGWDFSHIAGRYEEGADIPWDYTARAKGLLSPAARILDIDTGGGEVLLSLGHPHRLTAATEGYPPNAALCRETLSPLGIDFREADGGGVLPFPDGSFDLILNRHGDYREEEIFRLLKPGGTFLTQQVGAQNDRELVELLLPGAPLPYPQQTLAQAGGRLKRAGLTVLEGREHFGRIRFFEVGALVWFARIIEWEFPGFSVEGCFDRLCAANRLLAEQGALEGRTHRFLLIARKPD